MKRLFHSLLKGLLLLSLSLTGLMSLVGCGYQNGLTGSNPQGEPSADAQKPAGSCPDAEATLNDELKSKTAYIVSWDAVATDADSNQGNSVLIVSALDIATGKILWKKSPIKVSGMYQSSQQQVVDGVLYIVSTNLQSALMLAVDTHDGHAIWQREEKQKNVALLSICASKLYLEIDNSQLQALQTSNGQTLWSYNSKALLADYIATPQFVYLLTAQQPAISSDESVSVITLGANDGRVSQKTFYDHQPSWLFSLSIYKQQVYVLKQIQEDSTLDSTPVTSVQALDSKSSKILWTAHMPSNIGSIRVLQAGSILYLNGQNLAHPEQSLLLALNISNGKQLWLRHHSYHQVSILNEQDLYGYQGYSASDNPQGKKHLCSVESMTGRDSWCIETLQPSLFSLSSTKDMLMVEEELQPGPMTLVQNLYGINKHTGKILWKLPWQSNSPSMTTVTMVTVIEGQRFVSLIA